MIKRNAPSIPLESILIVSEDTKSSVNYLKEKIADLELDKCRTITIEVTGSTQGTSPDKVAASAINLCEKFNKEAKKQGILPYTKVYCLMDTDDWGPKLNEAKETLRQKSSSLYQAIVSHECFEVWYILHFKNLGDTKKILRPRKGVDNKMTIPDDERTDKLLESFLGIKEYEKGGAVYDKLKELGNENQAIKNATWLADYHTNNPTEGNPATDVYIVVTHLNRMAQTYNKPLGTVSLEEIKLADITVYYPFTDNFKNQLVKLINSVYVSESKENKLNLCNNILAKPKEVDKFTDNSEILAFVFGNQEIYT